MDGREQKVGRRGCEGELVAIGDGVLWATPCKRRRSLKRSLETAAAKAMSLGGSVVAIPIKSPVLHIYCANEKPLIKCD